MDAIDHKKGAQTLYDVWHFAKHLHRVALPLVGAFAVLAINSNVSIFAVMLVLLTGLVPCSLTWEYLYRSYWPTFVLWDNTTEISTGWRWLDARLGFGKQG